MFDSVAEAYIRRLGFSVYVCGVCFRALKFEGDGVSQSIGLVHKGNVGPSCTYTEFRYISIEISPNSYCMYRVGRMRESKSRTK